LSAWDGSHYQLEKAIKAILNDPKSYEHVRTSYSDLGDVIVVTTVFRAKNAFGGVITKSMTASFTFDGDFVEVIEGFD
jgi:hypothetical protein